MQVNFIVQVMATFCIDMFNDLLPKKSLTSKGENLESSEALVHSAFQEMSVSDRKNENCGIPQFFNFFHHRPFEK